MSETCNRQQATGDIQTGRLHAAGDDMSRGRGASAASSAPQRNGVVPVLSCPDWA